MSLFSWVGHAISTAGRALASVSHAIAQGIEDVADLASHIPIIGGLLHGVLGIATGPFAFTSSMLEGERLDHALLDDLKSKVTAYQEIAPYAATIVSFVPGIGSGVAAGIAASTAVMQGMPIDEAVMQGVKAALPGGAAAQAAFTLTTAAIAGDNLIQAGGNALIDAAGLPPQAKIALDVIYRASKGENIPKAALEDAYQLMPTPETKQAVQTAVAVALGKRLQDVAREQLMNLTSKQLDTLKTLGAKTVVETPLYQQTVHLLEQANPEQIVKTATKGGYQVAASVTPAGVKAGYNLVTTVAHVSPVRAGFNLGMGLITHTGVTRDSIEALRKKLTGAALKGFDAALSTHTAAVIAPPPPEPSPVTLAYYAGKTKESTDINDKVQAFMNAAVAADYVHRLQQAQADYYLRLQTPAAQAGYYLTYGLRGHPSSDMKAALVRDMSQDPDARAGVALALTAAGINPLSWWQRFLRLFGIGK